ncbi:DUF1707 domain-containing protein [Acidiferrimicrobium sp. IK]|uniref:DUF1707 SHOCT-like domain-containing protein n=1 Tax=Acidiferrimicrobium sp. IK TaxID=2871700 RepID=UPI0021CAE950|nr:DUF1707 domain-containing protein [Acidiferrimicrobium sp. IK]MCU4183236.1 DUF1707 domain-containing protein [Acidiferrimicrobium sp. IK]
MSQRMPDTMRIGDAEREQAAEDLRSHTVAGRLSMDEYAERLDAVYEAKTFGDLRPVMADLPPLRADGPPSAAAAAPAGPFVGPPPAPPGPHASRQAWAPPVACAGRGGGAGSVWMLWLVVAIALTAATHGLAWPVWFLGPWFWGSALRRNRSRSRRLGSAQPR